MIRTREELRAQGIGASTIDDRCRRGDYTRLLPGVVSTGVPDEMDRCRAIAAWCPSAVLSHRTAAWLQGMTADSPALFEATVPRSVNRRTPDWLTLYRSDLPPEAVCEVQGLPVTTPAVTLLGCTRVLPEREVGRMVDDSLGKTVERAEIQDLCRSHRSGTAALRRHVRFASTRALSEPERLFARALAQRNLPLSVNYSVGPYFCDFVDERSRTIIEIDGREFHSDPGAFRNDRRRQNRLVLDGWLVLRYAAADILEYLDACADEAAAVIRRRRHHR